MAQDFYITPFNLYDELSMKEDDLTFERIWTVYVHIMPKELANKNHDMYYVGVTSSLVNDRWHNGAGYRNQYFGKIIHNMDWNDIQHDIIAEHLTRQEASDMEKALIYALRSNDEEYGYNKTKGGGLKLLDDSVDLTGQVFGRWIVLNRNPQLHNEWICECSCDDHTISSIKTHSLINGETKSCGCLNKELMRKRQFKHGMTNTHLYGTWGKIKHSNNGCICDEWRTDFNEFYKWAIQSGYDEQLMLLRYDQNKEFSPSNCFWGTNYDKNRKRKNNLFFTYNGKTQTLQDWSNELDINITTLRNRLFRSKMPVEKAFSMPVDGTDSPSYHKAYLYEYKGEVHTLREFSEIYNIDLQKLRNRFRVSGRDIYLTLDYLLKGDEQNV